MTRPSLLPVFVSTVAVTALALGVARARDVPQVATGFMANMVCSETFVSGLDPDRILSETRDAMPGAGLLTWAMTVSVDRAAKDVIVSLLGLGRSRAVYRDGLGCHLDHGEAEGWPAIRLPPPQPALLGEIAPPRLVEPSSPTLAAALDRAFAEPDAPPFRRTHAVIVLKDGKLIAERYAPGVALDTPLLGFSATKSMTATLIGILVHQGKLALHVPAPITAWQSESDPRHAITVDHLLRHTAGLALGSSLQASLSSALEPVNRMKFVEPDRAAFAESMPLETTPGAVSNYHDGNTVILSQLIRDAAGGSAADVLRFAHRELLDPLGMRNVTIEFDAAGTPEGSSQMLASARDWARLGQLYLDDGVVAGRRILPAGWVAYVRTPTPNAFVGLGAGFWTNRGDSFGATYRISHGWPRDAFFAKGSLGQYVIVIPSERLVIARFGRTVNWPPEADGVAQLVSDVIAATRGE
ncbi:putative Beta-lactamase family protein; putative 6-aminohexanoate-dimer hydrolase [Bradyrhizobium sp. ORS 285]|uniref:serine hydrolase domain-containing protein n=1 Tax=Bradyrhizobium sp. ORS 285 TaxID=115808 RepID=UPI0002407E16|nr:serine hydrolase [Bradyrhizobium sp. ORS 285]CCD85003.1 putative Beta-lactamase family protein; 6-aminohexanoate-dimer hydrolase [Bradyrhizobium sp. ORS 285]SMX62234.1 putative Beta-lactamase family protein; putative 6-aminohexanoate-dimer hydrolase [Bradyrhizobium sp. ORS 285]